MSCLLLTWLWLSVGIFEILAVWFCAAMWVFEFLTDTENAGRNQLLWCGLISLHAVLIYGIACTFIPRSELRSSDKRKRMASQRGHMTILMYGLGCGAPGELLRVSYKSGYNGEKGASINKVWRAYKIHQVFFTLPQILLHYLALSAISNPITVSATTASLCINLLLLLGLLYPCFCRRAGMGGSNPVATSKSNQRHEDSDTDSHSD